MVVLLRGGFATMSQAGVCQRPLTLPSDTKLLLTKNYSEIFIFAGITNFMRNSLKKSFFPGNLESVKSLKNYKK